MAPGVQPPDVTAALLPKLQAVMRALPEGYEITTGGSVEESRKANAALLPILPVMVVLMLTVIMLQTGSFRLMGMVFATAPLGLVGAVPALLLTGRPFGFTAILGLIGLAGILMRNTLILVDQIAAEQARGLDRRQAIVEATVRRARPVVLTALAAVLAFLPLSLSSFWGPLAIVLIGGTIVGTVLTLFFLPALYALCFGVRRGLITDFDRLPKKGRDSLRRVAGQRSNYRHERGKPSCRTSISVSLENRCSQKCQYGNAAEPPGSPARLAKTSSNYGNIPA